MNGTARRILRALGKDGELSIATAIRLVTPRHRSHLDQYPLALLIEEGYAGMTINHAPPPGAEGMREHSLAITLHMFGLPKDEHGEVRYLGVTTSGSLDPQSERVFLKAKGALYLGEEMQRRWDRFYSLLTGFAGGVIVAVASAWLIQRLSLS